MEPEQTKRLHNKVKRANSIIIACVIALLIMGVVLSVAIIYQNQKNASLSRKQAQQNHKRTQEYVRCVAETLTIPIAQRSENALDNCTKAADDRTKEAESK